MKVSVELMKFYSDEEQWRLQPEELVARIGRQLGAVEEWTDIAPKYKGIIIAKVASCVPHANSDHLSVCKIDDGGAVDGVERDADNLVQVVCGAPNVRTGLTVAWLPPGVTVPESYGREPFVLGAREIRGELSNGMLASAKELDMGADHSGIAELDTDAAPGSSVAAAYHLNDVIIDIENKMFTHRPDGFGNLGVAREIAGIQGLPFQSPDWYTADAPLPVPESAEKLPLTIRNEIPGLVPRFVAIPISDVTIAPSPLWLQSFLQRLGIRPINNVVDVTNYYMVLTGQPLHAYDYDKVKALGGGAHAALTVRKPQPGERITLLNGKTIEPYKDAMLVAAGDTLVCVGGMIGGANSEVDENTRNVILEAATWDMFSIRRTSMHNGIFTDAVTRFSKGQSPLQNVAVAAKACEELKALAGAQVAGTPVDDNHVAPQIMQRQSVHAPIAVTAEFINLRLGTQLPANEIAIILNNVECRAEIHGDELIITPPFWRTDLEIPEDIVEEVGRLRGFDQLPHELPSRSTSAVTLSKRDQLKNRLRDLLAAAGANELQTYSFVPTKLMRDTGQNPGHAFAIRNALSPELQHYRMSLTPSLLEKVHPNIKVGYSTLALYEINKVHIKGDVDCDGLPREYQTLAFTYASVAAQPGAAYYQAKHYLEYLLGALHVPYKIVEAKDESPYEIGRQIFAPFEPKRAGYLLVGPDDEFGGFVGEYHARARKNLKLPEYSAGFEVDIDRLVKHQQPTAYRPLLKFPETVQDVCLKVASSVRYADLAAFVADALRTDGRLRATVAPLDIYQRSDDPNHRQITFRITLQHADRTLTTDEASELLDAMVAQVKTRVAAERI